jgi:hypothetical protein
MEKDGRSIVVYSLYRKIAVVRAGLEKNKWSSCEVYYVL